MRASRPLPRTLSVKITTTMLSIRINRDSVHAGDDFESHAKTIDAGGSLSIGDFLCQLRGTYLPGIAGGEATWIVSASGPNSNPIGVVAQQWREPRLRVPLSTSLGELFGSSPPTITFEYWCQKSPELVFSCISSGREPPSKY